MENKPIMRPAGKYFFLDNFYPHPIVYQKIKCSCSEAAFAMMKTTDPSLRAQIAGMPPGEAKYAGRNLWLREDWDSFQNNGRRFKDNVMKEILRVKFQDPELRQRLLETGNAHIEEGNYHGDAYWGTDLNAIPGSYRPKPGEVPGKNMLGKLLMEVREEIRTEDLKGRD